MAEAEIAAFEEAGLFASTAGAMRERAALKNLLERYLEVEAEAGNGNGWRPVLHEFEFRNAPLPGLNARIHGRIDRLDLRDVDGAARIVDYKDGRRRADPALFHLGVDLQIALYALAIESMDAARLQQAGWPEEFPIPSVHGAYYSLRRRRDEVHQELKYLKKEDWREVVHGHLRRYQTALQTRRFPAHPTADACTHCDFHSLCRVTDNVHRREAGGGEA